MQLSIIIPCYNEEGNLENLVTRLHQNLETLGINWEIVLIDDHSSDSTWEKMLDLKAKFFNLVLVQHNVNMGIVQSWHSGFKACSGELICTMDADLQYRPEDVPVLLSYITSHDDADLVQGWRKYHTQPNFLRIILSKGFSFLLNIIFRMNLEDIKSGFIIYKREALSNILNSRDDLRYFQHFITIAAHSKGYKIFQIPILFDKRNYGRSFITSPLTFSIKSMLDLPRAVIKYKFNNSNHALRSYSPKTNTQIVSEKQT